MALVEPAALGWGKERWCQFVDSTPRIRMEWRFATDLPKGLQTAVRSRAKGAETMPTRSVWADVQTLNVHVQRKEVAREGVPDVLVRAKQIILNKPGPSTPMNIKLITVLSPLLLAYSGTRFRQLQEWQSKRLPAQLCGGIQGRSMACISFGIRLELDKAQHDGSDLGGIKLDQSKCFDRIVPATAGALFLAFGAPKKVVNVFLKTYVGLKKHLSYRGRVSKVHSTCANGVAQVAVFPCWRLMCAWRFGPDLFR